MKRYILAFIAALTLSMGSTQAFRNTSTPQTAAEFRLLDPEPAHYKKFLMPDTAVVGDANDATQTMQPAPAKTWGNFAWNGTKMVWNGAKFALSLPSYVLSPLSIATSWTTSKMLTQMFKLPGIRNYLGEKTAAFVGSIVGLATIYAFNPFGISDQALATLHILLSVSFGMDVFERLCSLTAAMLKHEWKIAGMELAASVIIGLLIFDRYTGVRTAMSNGIAKTANAIDTFTGNVISNGANTTITAAKDNLLNPLLDMLSTSGYERAHTVANSLFSFFGYETDLHKCVRVSGQSPATCTQFVDGYKNGLATCEAHALSQGLTTGSEVCAKLVPQPNYEAMATDSMAMVPTPQEPIGTCYDKCQAPTSRALTETKPAKWNSEALQKSTDRINQVKDCVATTGNPSGTCAAQAYPSPVQTPGFWARFKSLFSWSTKPTPAKPSTFVQDTKQCMKNTGLDVNDCVDMASTVNMQGNQCPAYTTNACIKPVVTVATTECEAPVIVSKLYAPTKPAATVAPKTVFNGQCPLADAPTNRTIVATEQCPVTVQPTATPVDNARALTVVTAPVTNNVPATKPLSLPNQQTLVINGNAALQHTAQVTTPVHVDNARALTVVTAPVINNVPATKPLSLPNQQTLVINGNAALQHTAQVTTPVHVDNARALTVVTAPVINNVPATKPLSLPNQQTLVINGNAALQHTAQVTTPVHVDNARALTVVTAPVINNVPATKPLALPNQQTLVLSGNAVLEHVAQTQAPVRVDNTRALTVVTTPNNQMSPRIVNDQRAIAPTVKTNVIVADDQCPLVEPTECPAYVVTESACGKPAPQTTQSQAPVIVSPKTDQPMITNEPLNPWLSQTPSNSAPKRLPQINLQPITPMATLEGQQAVQTNGTCPVRTAKPAQTCPVPQQSFREDLLQCKKDTGLAISDCAGLASMNFIEDSATCPMIVANACSNPKPFYHPANPWVSISNLAHNTLNGARQYLGSAWNWFTKTTHDINTLFVDTAHNLKVTAPAIVP